MLPVWTKRRWSPKTRSEIQNTPCPTPSAYKPARGIFWFNTNIVILYGSRDLDNLMTSNKKCHVVAIFCHSFERIAGLEALLEDRKVLSKPWSIHIAASFKAHKIFVLSVCIGTRVFIRLEMDRYALWLFAHRCHLITFNVGDLCLCGRRRVEEKTFSHS